MMNALNGNTAKAIAIRLCVQCASHMLQVDCLPAYVGNNSSVYKCSKCLNTEKVTTVSRAWLWTCSKELQSPN